MLEIKVTVDIPQLNDVCSLFAGRVVSPQMYQKPEYITEELMPGVTRKVKAQADVPESAPTISTTTDQANSAATTTGAQQTHTAVHVQTPATTNIPTQPTAPVQTTSTASAVTGVPTTTQSYSMEELAIAATQLMDAGRREDVVALLSQFGVQALTLLPKEQYGAFATKLRELGAKI